MDSGEQSDKNDETPQNDMTASVQLPDDFPDDVPFPKSYTIYNVIEDKTAHTTTVMYETKDMTKDDLKFMYDSFGIKKAYEVTRDELANGNYHLEFKGDDTTFTIAIHNTNIPTVSVTYGTTEEVEAQETKTDEDQEEVASEDHQQDDAGNNSTNNTDSTEEKKDDNSTDKTHMFSDVPHVGILEELTFIQTAELPQRDFPDYFPFPIDSEVYLIQEFDEGHQDVIKVRTALYNTSIYDLDLIYSALYETLNWEYELHLLSDTNFQMTLMNEPEEFFINVFKDANGQLYLDVDYSVSK